LTNRAGSLTNRTRMSTQLVKKFKRADLSRAELTINRASQQATSISSSRSQLHLLHGRRKLTSSTDFLLLQLGDKLGLKGGVNRSDAGDRDEGVGEESMELTEHEAVEMPRRSHRVPKAQQQMGRTRVEGVIQASLIMSIFFYLKHQFQRSSCVIFFTNNPSQLFQINSLHVYRCQTTSHTGHNYGTGTSCRSANCVGPAH
jgi:hypothetical protein